MRYILLISLLTFGGCGNYRWEFYTNVPMDTSVDELLRIEASLRTNGYKRVRIHRICDWISIYATRQEGGKE